MKFLKVGSIGYRHVLLGIGAIGTAAYATLFLGWHSPPNPYVSVFDFIANAPSNEVGDFFAGLFSPLAFLWLVIGYLLQSHELHLQRDELGEQREELELTRKTMEAHVALIKEQTAIEEARVKAYFTVAPGGKSGGTWSYTLTNTGSTAYEVDVFTPDNKHLTRDHVGKGGAVQTRIEPGGDVSRWAETERVWTIRFKDIRGRRWEQVVRSIEGRGFADEPIQLIEE